jgi:hypothetical protein
LNSQGRVSDPPAVRRPADAFAFRRHPEQATAGEGSLFVFSLANFRSRLHHRTWFAQLWPFAPDFAVEFVNRPA